MKLVRELIADLRERRLWPLALALLVALVAVPTVFSKPASEKAPEQTAGSPPAGSGVGAVLTETRPAVTLNAGLERSRRVRRLARKDPFVQQALPKKKSSSSEASSAEGAGDASSVGGTTTDPGAITGTGAPSGDAGTGGGGTSEPQQQGDLLTYFEYTAAISFGVAGETSNSTLQRLDSLPSEEDPLIVFLGVLSDGETALFLLSSDAAARGDGECKPDDTKCTFLYMKKNDTEFLDVAGDAGAPVTTYELELRAIRIEELDDAPAASSATGGKTSQLRASQVKPRFPSDAARARAERTLFGVFDLVGF